MRLVCALTAFFLAFLMMRGVGLLSESSLFITLGAALQTTATVGLATTAMLLIADLATVAEFPQYHQLVLFTAYFVGLLAVSTLLFEIFSGYNLLDTKLQYVIPHRYAPPIFAAWAAYGATLWCHPSR